MGYVHSHFLYWLTKSRIISMHDMHDHDIPNNSKMNFTTPFRTKCSRLVNRPIKANGTRQYPTVLTISSKDLDYIDCTLCFPRVYSLCLRGANRSKISRRRWWSLPHREDLRWRWPWGWRRRGRWALVPIDPTCVGNWCFVLDVWAAWVWHIVFSRLAKWVP